jgi:ATP-dependent protease ClpP protease subunit
VRGRRTGKRFALPHSRILMHQPHAGGMQGQASRTLRFRPNRSSI